MRSKISSNVFVKISITIIKINHVKNVISLAFNVLVPQIKHVLNATLATIIATLIDVNVLKDFMIPASLIIAKAALNTALVVRMAQHAIVVWMDLN